MMVNMFLYGVPQVSTFASDFKVMKKWLKKYKLKNKKIVDLGSGTGKVLRFLERNFWAKVTGYEVDLGNYLTAIFFNKVFWLNAKIYLKNYFKADFSKYDYIYVYLFPELMDKLDKKIWSECRKWTIIFSNAFKFTNRKPIEILLWKNDKEEIYIYKVW